MARNNYKFEKRKKELDKKKKKEEKRKKKLERGEGDAVEAVEEEGSEILPGAGEETAD